VLVADAFALVQKCLGTLSPRDREILVRYVMLDVPAARVAHDLGISKTTVYTATWRAVRKLRHPHLSRTLLVLDSEGGSRGLILDC
jgi:DNA-directed RNA polymerase specialized sigma24 family protein